MVLGLVLMLLVLVLAVFFRGPIFQLNGKTRVGFTVGFSPEMEKRRVDVTVRFLTSQAHPKPRKRYRNWFWKWFGFGFLSLFCFVFGTGIVDVRGRVDRVDVRRRTWSYVDVCRRTCTNMDVRGRTQ